MPVHGLKNGREGALIFFWRFSISVPIWRIGHLPDEEVQWRKNGIFDVCLEGRNILFGHLA